MARYIDLEEFERRIKAHIKADPMDSISESALIEWCKDECIRQGYAMPTADVVPKSEVENIFAEIDKIFKTKVRYLYCNPSLTYVYALIEELKKKYTNQSCNDCASNTECDKATHIENYQIDGCMDFEQRKYCTDCRHFVGCECFDGKTCDLYEEVTSND